MANYILVHGGDISTDTWNALTKTNDYPSGGRLGNKIWGHIVCDLETEGHRVFAPTLKDEHKYGLCDHIQQICDLINTNNLKNVILVGHSYGGMVITGVANKIAEKIAFLVYLDAALPESGQSLFDILTLGGLDPIKVVGGTPKAYMEKLQFDAQKIKPLPKVFIFCTESEFAPVISNVKKKIAIAQEEWRCFELPTSHIPQCTMPSELSELLLKLGRGKSNI